jgi:4-aminobutyrate aminotransferase-like enzyme
MRKQRKSPAQKKRLAYRKDHILRVEYPNAFRRYWPRRKAQASQKERRQVRRLLDDLVPDQNTEARMDMPLRPVRRDRVRKWPGSAIPLGEHVPHRHYMRVYRTAWNFFKIPYDPTHHKARFIAFLEQITQEKTAHTAKVAAMFQELLHPPAYISDAQYSTRLDRRSRWLQAFVADEPEWGTRLQAWIAETKEEPQL